MPKAPTHIPALDAVRAIAVLLVICLHYWQTFAGAAYPLIGRLAVWGQSGVDLFFVLSGFLITGILLDSRGSPGFLRNFYARRILRIFPLYYLTLFAVYILAPLAGLSAWVPANRAVWFWLYLQNVPMTFAPALASGPEHFWSLAVEEQYYLVWPLLVMCLGRRKLLAVAASAIAISLLTREALLGAGTYFFTLARLDGLAMGSALAILARGHSKGLSALLPWAKRILLAAPLLAAMQLLDRVGYPAIVRVSKLTLISLVCAAFVVLAVEGRGGFLLQRVFASRALRSIGKYSYAMYVFHPFLLAGLRRAGLPLGLAGFGVCLVATYLAAWISWSVFERRFLALKHYFEYQPRPERRHFSVSVGNLEVPQCTP
jgi:peptidoglycan/LPS O-acetylase OafA/YrhL